VESSGTRPRRAVSVPRLAIQTFVLAVVFGAVLFVPAGTVRWPQAWIFMALQFGFSIAISAWLLRRDPDLLAERMTGVGRADQEKWDKVLLAVIAAAFFGWLAAMALEVRTHGPRLPRSLQIAGAVLLLLSFYAFFLVFRENAFLSPAVRIQSDRGQSVVSTGPYAIVRHPMYAAFGVYALGTALLLGSPWGIAGAALLVVLVAYRAVLEERLLRERLPGYAGYANRVRYRLVPGLW
jgi:protein-S-isoprenylcysteine O-methyltransferase Ste14